MALYLPNTFSTSTPVAEQFNIAGITLGIVGTDKAEQGALARPILSAHSPTLPFVDTPAEVAQQFMFPIAYADVVEIEYLSAALGIECTQLLGRKALYLRAASSPGYVPPA